MTASTPHMTLKHNERYRLEVRTGRQKYPREFIGNFLGTHNRGRPSEELVIDCRPVAGTQRIRTADIVMIFKVSSSTPKVVNRVVRPS